MTRRRWIVWIAVVAVLGGCGQARTGAGETGPGGDGLDRLRQQARDVLARYDKTIGEAGGQQSFVPIGELTRQIGNWESRNGDRKLSLLSGRVMTAVALPAAPQPTGEVVFDNGASQTVPVISAGEALEQLTAASSGNCPECIPLEVIGARLTTVRIRTTRGPATAPGWEYALKGTAVRLTRVAVADSAIVPFTPPSWDPYNAPGGLAIGSATTTAGSSELTVTFAGAPGPGSQPCGADYSAEAVESVNAVAVIVIAHPHAAGQICPAIGAERSATVDLAKPLGERAVLEVQQGLPVQVRVTG